MRPPRLFYAAFGLFAGAVLFSLAGMAALALAPSVGATVGPILGQLMRWPTWIYSAALPLSVFLAFVPVLGLRRGATLAAWGTLVGAAAELLGTTTGFPFGPYSYSDFLGAKILDRVPWAIPPSWYAAALLSFAFASAAGVVRTRRVLLAAGFLVLWDVALDPAMSAGFPVWQWHVEGVYYGMPLVNWAGWFGTALVIMTGFERLVRSAPLAAGPWPARIWAVNGLFALGICVKAGLWPAAVIGAAALAVPPLLAARAGRRRAATAAAPTGDAVPAAG